jgi:hypothetical protein
LSTLFIAAMMYAGLTIDDHYFSGRRGDRVYEGRR